MAGPGVSQGLAPSGFEDIDISKPPRPFLRVSYAPGPGVDDFFFSRRRLSVVNAHCGPMDPAEGNAYAPGPGSELHSFSLALLVEPMLQDALLRNLSLSVGIGL